MTTCPSTQPQASGTRQVTSRGSRLPPPPPFRRQTRTAQKAAKPISPESSPPTTQIQPALLVEPTNPTPLPIASLSDQSRQEGPLLQPSGCINPRTHPVHDDSRLTLPSLNIPSISHLRDFPNLSFPLQIQHQPSVIVTLPQSAPSSPIASNPRTLTTNIPAGIPVTPTRSPEVSVIQENPACLLPAPPPRPPRSSTPSATPASSEG